MAFLRFVYVITGFLLLGPGVLDAMSTSSTSDSSSKSVLGSASASIVTTEAISGSHKSDDDSKEVAKRKRVRLRARRKAVTFKADDEKISIVNAKDLDDSEKKQSVGRGILDSYMLYDEIKSAFSSNSTDDLRTEVARLAVYFRPYRHLN